MATQHRAGTLLLFPFLKRYCDKLCSADLKCCICCTIVLERLAISVQMQEKCKQMALEFIVESFRFKLQTLLLHCYSKFHPCQMKFFRIVFKQTHTANLETEISSTVMSCCAMDTESKYDRLHDKLCKKLSSCWDLQTSFESLKKVRINILREKLSVVNERSYERNYYFVLLTTNSLENIF